MSEEERREHDAPADAGELFRWAQQTQRTIDFILQQQARSQAKTEADMQQLRELHERSERRWEQTADGIRALLAIAEIHEREIGELREAQERTGEQMSETDRRMAETDERLNALINTVERIISERRNGGLKGQGEADE